MANTMFYTVATDPSPQSSRYREIVADKVFLYHGSNVETPTMLYIHISNLRPPKTLDQGRLASFFATQTILSAGVNG